MFRRYARSFGIFSVKTPSQIIQQIIDSKRNALFQIIISSSLNETLLWNTELANTERLL